MNTIKKCLKKKYKTLTIKKCLFKDKNMQNNGLEITRRVVSKVIVQPMIERR
jgi:hypothetical protein